MSRQDGEGRTAGFRSELHLLRGFAIFSVVAVHALDLTLAGVDRHMVDLSLALFHNSTVYFAAISGLIYTAVLREKGRARYFRSRPASVFLPYVVVSLAAMAWFGSRDPMQLLLGTAMVHLWYVPVLALLLLATPLIERVLTPGIALIAFVVPMLAVRTAPEPSWANVLHMAGPYVVGMYVGAHYDKAMALLRGRGWLLLAIGGLWTLVAWHDLSQGAWPTPPYSDLVSSATYLRSLAWVLALMVLLEGRRAGPVVDRVASLAFPIYFLHMPVLLLTDELVEHGYLAAAVALLWGFAFPIFATLGLRRAIGDKSRYLVGG